MEEITKKASSVMDQKENRPNNNFGQKRTFHDRGLFAVALCAASIASSR
jgi:hypothetical protein